MSLIPATVCVLAVALATGKVSAQDPPRGGEPPGEAQPAAEIALARALFVEGVESARAARWQDARDRFAHAHALLPQPIILFNLAAAEVELGRLVEASESYRRFLRSAGDADAPLVPRAERSLADVEARLARLIVTLTGLGPDDRIVLDGATLQHEALDQGLPLDPGDHVLRVERSEAVIAEHAFSVGDGETVEVAVDVPAPPPPPVEPSIDLTVPLTGSPAVPQTVPQPDDGPGWLGSPWLWLGLALVVGGATLAGVLVSTQDEPETIVPGGLEPGVISGD